jgi:hypothetical protein
MVEYLEVIEKIIGHIAWPAVVLIVFYSFRKEIKSVVSRIKSAEIKDVKFELEDKIDEMRKEALDAGVTMFYPIETLQREFNAASEKTKEAQILESWGRIENILSRLDDRGQKSSGTVDVLSYLVKAGKIEKYLANIIMNLSELRDIVVRKDNVTIAEDEYQNWMSISKSVIDRLSNKI